MSHETPRVYWCHHCRRAVPPDELTRGPTGAQWLCPCGMEVAKRARRVYRGRQTSKYKPCSPCHGMGDSDRLIIIDGDQWRCTCDTCGGSGTEPGDKQLKGRES